MTALMKLIALLLATAAAGMVLYVDVVPDGGQRSAADWSDIDCILTNGLLRVYAFQPITVEAKRMLLVCDALYY